MCRGKTRTIFQCKKTDRKHLEPIDLTDVAAAFKTLARNSSTLALVVLDVIRIYLFINIPFLACVAGAYPLRVSLARARSLFRPLLPSACYAGYSFSFLREKVLKSSKTVLVLLSVLFSLFTSTETSFLKFALKKPYFQITTAQVFGIIQFLNCPRFYRLLHFHDGKHGQYCFQNCIQNLIMPKNMIMLSLMLQM